MLIHNEPITVELHSYGLELTMFVESCKESINLRLWGEGMTLIDRGAVHNAAPPPLQKFRCSRESYENGIDFASCLHMMFFLLTLSGSSSIGTFTPSTSKPRALQNDMDSAHFCVRKYFSNFV